MKLVPERHIVTWFVGEFETVSRPAALTGNACLLKATGLATLWLSHRTVITPETFLPVVFPTFARTIAAFVVAFG